jgi:hypothetical protein
VGGERVRDVELLFELLDVFFSISKILISLIHLLHTVSLALPWKEQRLAYLVNKLELGFERL